MTFQEIVDKIHEIGVSEVAEDDFEKDSLPLTLIHEKGGHEGDGDYAERVFKHDVSGVIIKITGFYSSYSGTDWDSEIKEVKPVEKTITVYEPV